MKNRLNILLCIIHLIVSLCFIEILYAENTSIESLEQTFIELPLKSRRLTGPLFWLHGDESKERLESYVEKVAEGGNGCFTAESRPHSDWLGEGWYRDLGICLEAAKKNNLKMWIFDEKWWPSGEVGGMVPQQYGSKYMQAEAIEITGSRKTSIEIAADKLIAVLAGKVIDDRIDGDSLVDLTESVQDGVLNWKAPRGDWRVMVFRWRYSDGRHGKYLVDGASQEAVDWYIQTVYQPHYDRFKEDFGTWIPGFFYDEPETYGDWGTEVIPLLKERRVDWKKALVAWKFTLAGQEQAAAKYQYQDAFAEAWGRTLFGGISEWCRDHGVISIGHFLEHGNEYLSQRVCAGNMFQLQKYSDMGGIDAVFDQFIMGKRIASSHPTWQTPKLGSSISHVYGKPDDVAMVEIFGARGQDLTYPEMKWWTDHMHVSGINFHIPHAFNPRAPYDTDCPPYFYNGGAEPRWPLYKVYADYTSRLSLMLSGGRHVCPVALLFVGNSAHVGKAVPPEQMSEALQDALYDCDWMPYEVFEKDVQLDADQMKLYQERYRVLIVPPVEVIPYETLEKAYEFFKSGGVVVGYDFLPDKASDIGRTSQGIQNLCRSIWGDAKAGIHVCCTNPAGGRSYFLPANPTVEQIQQVLAEDAGRRPTLEVLEGDTSNWLHVLHRVKDDRDIFFICNQNIDGGQRSFRLRIKAKGFPEYWDPMRGEVTSVPFTRDGESVEVSLKLDSLESTVFVFNLSRRDLPERIEISDSQADKVLPVIPLERSETIAAGNNGTSGPLDDCGWVWMPDQDATTSVSPGDYYFRGAFSISPKSKSVNARFIGTADNEIDLYVNGNQVHDKQGTFEDWKKIADIEITDFLVEGHNMISIKVANRTDQSSPAGLIGKIELMFKDGLTKTIPIDQHWKVHDRLISGWQKKDFEDSKWTSAAAVAPFGAGPWGMLGRMLTLSPVKHAEPFVGQVELGTEIEKTKQRCILQMGSVQPETAVRVSVNGKYTGGCIGSPLCKDITQYLTSGKNIIKIEPFYLDKVHLYLYTD